MKVVLEGQPAELLPANDAKLRMTRIQAIKKFFGEGTARPLENREIMLMSMDARRELGDMALIALGAELMEATA